MATYTPQALSLSANVTPTMNAASASDDFFNDGKTIAWVVNGGVGSITVTIPSYKTVAGLTVPDRTVTVPSGATRVIGPFDKDVHNNSDGKVTLQFSGTTSVTFALLRFP